jgi:spore germination protein PD
MIHFQVINHALTVGHIELLGVSSASMLQVGDTDHVSLYSVFETPPESVIVGPLAPFPLPDNASDALGEPSAEDDDDAD